MADAQFRLQMILDATSFETGSRKATDQMVAFSAAVKSAGLSAEELAQAWIKDAEAAVRAGNASKELIATLDRTKAKMQELNAEAGRQKDQSTKGFAEQFTRAELKASEVLRFTNQIGLALGNIASAKMAEGPFARLLADEIKIKQETVALSQAIKNLFGDGIASATTMSDVMRTLSRVFAGTQTNTQGMRLAILDVKRAFTELQKQAPSLSLSKGIELASQLIKDLRRNADLTPDAFKKITAQLKPLAQEILGVDISVKALAEQLRTLEGRRAFLRQLQDLEALGNSMASITVKAKEAFAQKFGSSFITDLAKIREESDKLTFIKATEGLQRFLEKNNRFKAALAQTGGTIQDLTQRQAILEGFLNRFGILANSTREPVGSLRTTIEGLSRSMGIAFTQGDSVGDFLRRVQNHAALTRRELDQLTAATNRASASLRNAASSMNKFNELTSVAIQKIIRYRVAFFAMSKTIMGLRSAVEVFKEVQTELAEIEKVVEPVAGQMKLFREAAFGFAQQFGEEIGNVLNIMKVWAQQGKTFNEILSLTESTLLAAAGAGLTTEQAVEGLTAATKAYNIPAEQTIGIVDKLANVQAKFAVTAQDLADAIRLISSAADAVGITLDELLGQITAIASVTRKSGQAVAQSLKTIFARFERTTTINQFKALNIEIQKTDGAMRPLGEVLTELNRKWAQFTDAQRFAIAQSVAGVHRYADFLVLMENYDEALLATKASLEAQGQAQRNAAIEIATFARQIQQTQSTLQQTFVEIADAALAPALAGLLGLVRVFAELQNAVPGLNFLVGSMTALAVALFSVKAAFVGGELIFGQFVRISGELTGANQRLAASVALVADDQERELVQKTLNIAKDKERLALNQALLTADSKRIAVASAALATEVEKTGALTAGEAATVAAAIAQTGYNTSLSFGAVVASKFTLALQVLRATFFSTIGLISIGVTVLSILVGKWLLARDAALKFNESQGEIAKNLARRVKIEQDLVTTIDDNIKRLDALTELLDKSAGSENELATIQLARIDQSKKLIELDSRMNRARSESNELVLESAAAYEVLGEKIAEVNKLIAASETINTKTKASARAVRDAIFESQRLLADFDPSKLEFATRTTFTVFGNKKTFNEALADSEKQARVLAKAAVFAFKETNIDVSMDDLIRIEEESFKEQFIALGKEDAIAYVTALTSAMERNFDKVKPILEARRREFGSLGKDIDKLIDTADFGAFKSQTIAELGTARDEADLRGIIDRNITPLEDFSNQLSSISEAAANTITELTKMEVAAESMRRTGFIAEDLNKVLESTIVNAVEAANVFKAFSLALNNTSQSGANIEKIYSSVGIAFNDVAAKAERAEQTANAFARVMEKLAEIEQNPDQIVPEEFIAQVSQMETKMSLTGKEIEERLALNFAKAGKSLEVFKRQIKDTTTESGRELNAFLSEISDDPNRPISGERLIANLLAVQEEARKMGATKEQIATLALVVGLVEQAWAGVQKEAREAIAAQIVANARMEELSFSANRFRDDVNRSFGTLKNLGNSLGLTAKQNKILVDIQNRALKSQIENLTKITFMNKVGLTTETQWVDAQRDMVTAVSAVRAEVTRNVLEQVRLNEEAQRTEEIQEAIELAVKKTTRFIEDQRDAFRNILDLQTKVFEARSEELGILEETQNATTNRARIAAVETELDFLNKIKTAIALGKAELGEEKITLDDILKRLQASPEEIVEIGIMFNRLGKDTSKWDDEIHNVGRSLKQMKIDQIFLDAAQAVAEQNRLFESQEKTISNLLETQKAITKERQTILGASSSRQARIDAEFQVRQLEEEIERKKQSIILNDADLAAAQQKIAATTSTNEAQTALNNELLKTLGLRTEDVLKLLELNQAVQELREQLRAAQDDLVFKKSLESIEDFNTQLDESLDLQKGLLELLTQFDEQSVVFNRTVGPSRLRQLNQEIQLEKFKAQQGEQRLALLQEELASARSKLAADEGNAELQRQALKIQRDVNSAMGELQQAPERIRELQREAVIAELAVSKIFQKALEDSQTFTAMIQGAADAIAGFFSTLPESIVSRFEEVKRIQTDLAKVQAEIVKTQAASVISGNFDEASQALVRLRAEQDRLNRELNRAKSIVNTIRKEFLRLGSDVGQAVLEVRTDILKKQLEELLGSAFGDNERQRRQDLHNAIVAAHQKVTQYIVDGFVAGAAIIAPQQGGVSPFGDLRPVEAGGITAAPKGSLKTFGSEHIQTARMLAEQKSTSDQDAENADDWKTAGERMKEAGKQLLAFAGVALGTAAGGGGPNAAMGAQFGSILGLLPGPFGLIGSVVGPLLGGLLGGKLDEETKQVQEENTAALRENTLALQDLRSEMINAPARFILPAAASLGGFVGEPVVMNSNSDLPSSNMGSVTVQLNFGNSVDPNNVGNIEQAVVAGVTRAYQDSQRRFGRRLNR